ncbi:PAS domain S-box protein [Candidatus Poribacteria bacterium]|nr:PAS domain S-box protein [Candidatus Poribacteria bacterium]
MADRKYDQNDLRRRAEKQIEDQEADLDSMSPDDIKKLVHELRVHQVELEMQNDELRRIQQALQDSRDSYSDLYDFAPVGYLTVNEKGIILKANLTCATMLGIDRGKLTGKPLAQFVFRDERDKFYLHRRKLFEEKNRKTCELRMVRKDGKQFYAQFESIINGDNNTGEDCCQIVISDITEKKQAEEALIESERNLKLAQKAAHIGSWKYYVKTRELYWSDELYRIYCLDPESTKASLEHGLGMIHPDDREVAEKTFRNAVENAMEYDITYRIIRPDGVVRFIEGVGKVEEDEKGEILSVYGTGQDITERKKMEEELQKMEKLESIGILAGGIAHDLNNLLVGVIGGISMAKMSEDKSRRDKVLDKAEKAAMRIRGLTTQLLTFSKGGTPVLETVDIKPLLEESTRFALSGSNVICNLSIPENIKPVDIDEGQINQVINNLVINAKQAMSSGGNIWLNCENVYISEKDQILKPGEYVKITIQDEGIGIPQNHLDKIFDPFFTTKQQGSGLGLTASYSIIQKHRGYIAVESEMGEGSTFNIYLPASYDVSYESEQVEEKTSIRGNGKILVMDDEDFIRDMLRDMLNELGYTAATVSDGFEAIGAYQQAMDSGEPYDAVILDLTVPGSMGGLATVKNLLEIDPEVKSIVSSGYSDDEAISKFREHGFKGFITKPYKLKELDEVINNMLSCRS